MLACFQDLLLFSEVWHVTCMLVFLFFVSCLCSILFSFPTFFYFLFLLQCNLYLDSECFKVFVGKM